MVIKSEQGPLRWRKAKIEKLDCAPFEVLIGESKHNFSFSSAILKVEASLSQKRKRVRNLIETNPPNEILFIETMYDSVTDVPES